MTGHENLVTYTWLIGSGLTVLGIIAILSIAILTSSKHERDKKVDITVCDQKHIPISIALEKLDKINDAVVRIEAILNGKPKGP